jgi:hypothetical protein
MIYKQIYDIVRQQVQQNAILRVTDSAYIPFDPANTDYQTFKKEVLAGAELQDADGNVMTDASAFIQELP